MKTTNEARNFFEAQARDARSAWRRGVAVYALDLIFNIEDYKLWKSEELPTDFEGFKKMLLNGASTWDAFSWGGCSLIYNEDIARRLCCPSELKKTRNGERKPNAREEWLDTQARALTQAAASLWRFFRG